MEDDDESRLTIVKYLSSKVSLKKHQESLIFECYDIFSDIALNLSIFTMLPNENCITEREERKKLF